MPEKNNKHVLSEPVEFEGQEYSVLVFGKFKNSYIPLIPDEWYDMVEAVEYAKIDPKDPEEVQKEKLEKAGIKLRGHIRLANALTPLMAKMTNTPLEVLEEVSMEDIISLSNMTQSFLAESPTAKN